MASKKSIRIDFSGVDKDIRQRAKHIQPGDYACKIVSWKKKWKEDDKSNPPYLQWRFQIVDGKAKGVPLYYITSLKTDALFNLRNLIFAATDGKKNVAGKSVDFDPDALVGKKIAVLVDDEEWEGRVRSKAVDVRPLSELSGDEGESDDEEDDEEEEDSDEDEEEDDEEEDLDEVDTDDI